MKMKALSQSFQKKLFLSLVLTTVLLLILCCSLLILLFRAVMNRNSQTEASSILDKTTSILDPFAESIENSVSSISSDPMIQKWLSRPTESIQVLYNALYPATDQLRKYAEFSLFSPQGLLLCSTSINPSTNTLPNNWGILRSAFHSEEMIWQSTDDETCCIAAKRILDQNGLVNGYIVVYIGRSAFDEILPDLSGSQSVFIVLDELWRPVYCSNPEIEDTISSTLRLRLLSGSGLDTVQDRYSVRTDSVTPFIFVIQQPERFAGKPMQVLIIAAALMVMLSALLSILIALRLSHQLNAPLAHLQDTILRVENGDRSIQASMNRKDEFGILAESFDRMVSRLDDNTVRLVEGRRQLDEARIRLMQSQLNPHFLCNTLDTVKWIGKINHVPDISEIATDLADILRSSISTNEFIPLEAELELLERYLDIQRIRFPGKFDIEFDIPPDLLDCIIPKFMLQPLVENAILHGLNNRESGKIRIHAEHFENNRFLICIEDNGCGIDLDMVSSLLQDGTRSNSGHLGLYNVNTILETTYGSECGLHFRNLPGGGTSVFIILPIQKAEAI